MSAEPEIEDGNWYSDETRRLMSFNPRQFPPAPVDVDPQVRQEFDGQLITVIHGLLHRFSVHDSLLLHHGTRTAYPGEHAVNILDAKKNPLDTPKDWPRNLPGSIEKSGYDRDIVQMILDGRLLMTYLINSPGGDPGITKRFLRINRHANKIVTIASTEAQSAGAFLFAEAKPEDRYALEQTKILFHGLNVDAIDRPTTEREILQREIDKKGIIDFFQRECHDKLWNAYVEQTLRKNGDVRLTGKKMHEFGMTKLVPCNNVRERPCLDTQIEKTTGLDVVADLNKIPHKLLFDDFRLFTNYELEAQKHGLTVRVSRNGYAGKISVHVDIPKDDPQREEKLDVFQQFRKQHQYLLE